MGPKMLRYARQFADFNIGGHFNFIHPVRVRNNIMTGCLMCVHLMCVCCVFARLFKIKQICVDIKQPS